jgi:two-component system cell cycle response regulator DivK
MMATSSDIATFLYVEDDKWSREVVETIFQRILHSTCYVFPDSENFLENMAALPVVPDIALLDIQVSPYDGYSMLRMLRSDARYQHIRMIAITASVTVDEIKRLKQDGFDGLIGKPIKREAFVDSVNRILKGQSVWTVTQ